MRSISYVCVCLACRTMDLRHSMDMQDMDNSSISWVSSTRVSQPPSLSSPQCSWLEPHWLTLSTTTCATQSSCCSAACHLELLPSSTPFPWVRFTNIYSLLFLVHSHGYTEPDFLQSLMQIIESWICAITESFYVRHILIVFHYFLNHNKADLL